VTTTTPTHQSPHANKPTPPTCKLKFPYGVSTSSPTTTTKGIMQTSQQTHPTTCKLKFPYGVFIILQRNNKEKEIMMHPTHEKLPLRLHPCLFRFSVHMKQVRCVNVIKWLKW
jgi:hypothetical protein